MQQRTLRKTREKKEKGHRGAETKEERLISEMVETVRLKKEKVLGITVTR